MMPRLGCCDVECAQYNPVYDAGAGAGILSFDDRKQATDIGYPRMDIYDNENTTPVCITNV